MYVEVKNYIDDVITNGWVRKSGCLGLRIFLTIYGMNIGLLHQICQRLIIRATPLFLYKWLKIPFGLTNVPSCFQRYINKCLAGLQDIICVKYLDDLLIYGRTFEKHVKNAEKFLQQLRESGIKLNPAKCNFFKREMIYLGQPISKDGYYQDPQNNDTLEKFRTPPKIIGKLWFLLFFPWLLLCLYKKFFQDNETFV